MEKDEENRGESKVKVDHDVALIALKIRRLYVQHVFMFEPGLNVKTRSIGREWATKDCLEHTGGRAKEVSDEQDGTGRMPRSLLRATIQYRGPRPPGPACPSSELSGPQARASRCPIWEPGLARLGMRARGSEAGICRSSLPMPPSVRARRASGLALSSVESNGLRERGLGVKELS